MESILDTIKKLLGPDSAYEVFDEDIIVHINTALADLTQLGVGPAGGFKIEDNTAEWTDFIEDNIQLEAVSTYMYLKVKLLFDPPPSSAVIQSMKEQIAELEWRLNVAVD